MSRQTRPPRRIFVSHQRRSRFAGGRGLGLLVVAVVAFAAAGVFLVALVLILVG